MRVQKGDRAMDKEKQILNYMQKLGLTREEAEQLYKDEEEDNLPEREIELRYNGNYYRLVLIKPRKEKEK